MLQSWFIKLSLADGSNAVFEKEHSKRPSVGDAALLVKNDILPPRTLAWSAEEDECPLSAVRLLSASGIHVVGIRRRISSK
jgi:hypothetical protein